MHDFHVCPHGPCAGALEKAQAVVSRLEALMRRCREERHQVCYADLLELASGAHPPCAPVATFDAPGR